MNFNLMSALLKPAWLRATLLCAVACGISLRAEEPSAEAYEKDVNFLASKVAQYRYRLKGSTEGAQRLSTLETTLAQMKAATAELRDQASAIQGHDGRLHYYKEMELGPKWREVERVRQTRIAWNQEIGAEREVMDQAWRVYSSGQLKFETPREEAAYQAKWAEKHDLDRREEALSRKAEQRNAELRQLYDAAFQAYTKVQKEFSEIEVKHEKATQVFQAAAERYNESRRGVVEQLVALDNEPPPAVNVPLTPFSPGVPVPPGEAGLVPAVPPPIGPGNNTHAIDQLLVATGSSRAGAGRDEHDQQVNTPLAEVAKTDISYAFDTGEGVAKAELPDVATPASRPVEAVPLVVPPSPAAAPDAPAPIKESPGLKAFAEKQSAGLSQLDKLYQQRRELMQQGAQATPEAWTKVVKDISQAQADVNFAGVGLKLAAGSQLLDLNFDTKKQTKISDLTVPPPPSPKP